MSNAKNKLTDAKTAVSNQESTYQNALDTFSDPDSDADSLNVKNIQDRIEKSKNDAAYNKAYSAATSDAQNLINTQQSSSSNYAAATDAFTAASNVYSNLLESSADSNALKYMYKCLGDIETYQEAHEDWKTTKTNLEDVITALQDYSKDKNVQSFINSLKSYVNYEDAYNKAQDKLYNVLPANLDKNEKQYGKAYDQAYADACALYGAKVINTAKEQLTKAQNEEAAAEKQYNTASDNYSRLQKIANEKKNVAKDALQSLTTAQNTELAKHYLGKVTIRPITMTAGQTIPSPEVIVADNQNASPKASLFVVLATEPAGLPTGTKVAWNNSNQVTSDAKIPGSHTETVKVSFSDCSALLIPTVLTVEEPATTPSTPSEGHKSNPSTSIKGDGGQTTPSNPTTPSKGHDQTPGKSQGGKTSTPSDTNKGQDQPTPSNPTTTNKGQDKTTPSTPSNTNVDHNQPSQPASTPNSTNDVTTVSRSHNDAVLTQNTESAATITVQQSQPAQSKHELPQTGNSKAVAVTVLGALTAMLGLGLAKKREF